MGWLPTGQSSHICEPTAWPPGCSPAPHPGSLMPGPRPPRLSVPLGLSPFTTAGEKWSMEVSVVGLVGGQHRTGTPCRWGLQDLFGGIGGSRTRGWAAFRCLRLPAAQNTLPAAHTSFSYQNRLVPQGQIQGHPLYGDFHPEWQPLGPQSPFFLLTAPVAGHSAGLLVAGSLYPGFPPDSLGLWLCWCRVIPKPVCDPSLWPEVGGQMEAKAQRGWATSQGLTACWGQSRALNLGL